eukprot:17504-Heterococcus_DN1.PRE.4
MAYLLSRFTRAALRAAMVLGYLVYMADFMRAKQQGLLESASFTASHSTAVCALSAIDTLGWLAVGALSVMQVCCEKDKRVDTITNKEGSMTS